MDEPTSYTAAISRYSDERKSEFRIQEVMGQPKHCPHTEYIVRTTEHATSDGGTNATR